MNENLISDESNLNPQPPTESESVEINKIITRSQSKQKSVEKSEQTAGQTTSEKKLETRKEAEEQSAASENKTTSSNTPILKIEDLERKSGEINVKKMQNNNMATLQLQQLIASTIPEFKVEANLKNPNNLSRFISTADPLYESLKTEDEQKIFNSLIKSKLSDDAFNRVNDRDIKTYPELKKLLNSMYKEAQTLEELEKNYSNIKQTYGESVRNFGFRILEALDKYKKGYKYKYSTDKIDPTYEKHLQINTVKIFKRGLNNTILKDKITTSTNADLESIILETEVIEKMLVEINTPTDNEQIKSEEQNTINQPSLTQTPNQFSKTICNHCQKPGHTLGDCRIRINSEMIAKNKVNLFQLPQRQFLPQFNQQQIRRYTPQQFEKPIKYCSYCKTTTGHTFDECQKKFLQRRPQINMNFSQPNYQGNQHFQQRRNNFNGRQQYQQPNIQYEKPQMSYVPYQQQHNNSQNYNFTLNRKPNYAQGYSQQNNYQQRNNYPINNPYQQNYYSQQQDNNEQRNYSQHYIKDRNQQTTNENFRSQNRPSNNQTITQPPGNDSTRILQDRRINIVYPGQELLSEDMNPENSNGSIQN